MCASLRHTAISCSTYSILWRVLVSSLFFQAEDGIRDLTVTGVQTCALPISRILKPVSDGVYGANMLYAEFAAGESAPVVELTSRFQTQDRALDWSKKTAADEDRSEERRVGKECRSRWSPDH